MVRIDSVGCQHVCGFEDTIMKPERTKSVPAFMFSKNKHIKGEHMEFYQLKITRKGTKPSRKGNESYQLLKTSTQDINNEDNVRRGGALLLAFLFLSALTQEIKSFIQESRYKKRSKQL